MNYKIDEIKDKENQGDGIPDDEIQGNETSVDEPWVLVATFRDLPPAHIASGILESQGLTPKLSDEYTVGADWLISSAIGGVGLGVPASQKETARQLLDGSTPDLDDSDLPEELHQVNDEDEIRFEESYFAKHQVLRRTRGAMSLLIAAPALFLVAISWSLMAKFLATRNSRDTPTNPLDSSGNDKFAE